MPHIPIGEQSRFAGTDEAGILRYSVGRLAQLRTASAKFGQVGDPLVEFEWTEIGQCEAVVHEKCPQTSVLCFT